MSWSRGRKAFYGSNPETDRRESILSMLSGGLFFEVEVTIKYPCFFCGKEAKRIPAVGISMSMGGEDYSFCYKCLKSMTADAFWRKIFNKEGLKYPPKLLKQ